MKDILQKYLAGELKHSAGCYANIQPDFLICSAGCFHFQKTYGWEFRNNYAGIEWVKHPDWVL